MSAETTPLFLTEVSLSASALAELRYGQGNIGRQTLKQRISNSERHAGSVRRSFLDVGSVSERVTQRKKIGGEHAIHLNCDPVECDQQLTLLMRREFEQLRLAIEGAFDPDGDAS